METGPKEINIAEALESCRRPLLDTGGRSRLINFPINGRKTKRWLRIIGENPNQVFDRLVIRNQSFSFEALPKQTLHDNEESPLIRPDGEPTFAVDQTDGALQVDRDEAVLDGCLETIAREARSCIDETGVNMLYLSIGMLEWFQASSAQEPTYAPLILIPVELKKEFSERRGRYIYPVRHNGQELLSNLSLAKRLEDDFGLKMPLLEGGQSPSEYFSAIQRDVLAHQTRWRTLDHIVLAFFRFQKQLLYLDLDPRNWSNSDGKVDNAQIRKVFEGVDRGGDDVTRREDEKIDSHRTAQDMLIVMDADSSQHSALCDIAEGHDLVIEGPPGTGKSQTIINAIASSIASGKTVLFVAEKLAALKVVYDRMKDHGLEDLCLNLHSDQATPKLVFDDLGRRLDARFRSPHQLDAVRRDLMRKRQSLDAYLKATAKPAGPLKLPLHDVFWRAAKLAGRGAPLLRDECNSAISRDIFNDSITVLTALARHIDELGPLRDCPWWGFECRRLPQADIPLLASHLQRMLNSATALSQQSEVLDDLVGSRVEWYSSLHKVGVAQLKVLDEVTAEVDARLCRHIADPSRAQAARDLKRELEDFLAMDAKATAASTTDWPKCESHADQFVTLFRDRFKKPIGTDATLENLTGWRSRLSQSLELLDRLASLMDQLHSLGFRRATSLSQTRLVVDLYRLITDDRVLNSHGVCENLLLASTEHDFVRAREQQRHLQTRHDKISEVFVVSDVPDREALGALRRTMRPYVKRWHRWLWGEYRRARAELMRFLVPDAKREVALWVSTLDELDKWQTDTDNFAADPHLVNGLGPAFKGWDTRWDDLEHLVRWGKTLASRGIEGTHAISLVKRCNQAESRPHLTVLQALVRQLDHELAELPPTIFGVSNTTELCQLQFETLRSLLSHWRVEIESLLEATTGLRQEQTSTLGQLDLAAKCVVRAAELKRAIDESSRFRHALPEFFVGTQTPVAVLDAALNMIDRLSPLHMSVVVLQWLFDADPTQHAAALHAGLDEWMNRRDKWSKRVDESAAFGECDPEWFGVWGSSQESEPPALIRRLLGNLDILPTWIEFCRSRDRCGEIGLSPYIQAVADNQLKPNQLVASFDRTVHDLVARQETERDECLRNFSRLEHEQARADFAKLDRELIRLQCEQVRWMAGNRRPPDGVSTGHVGNYTQMGLIRHEVSKQRRHCSLRDLVRRAGEALAAIKPCWMMSPLSVAQFIEPGALVFHVLIMDEASQIKPEDALGSVARAEQVVVVGDPKQMPPSSWMERSSGNGADDDDEADEKTLADDNESILEWGMSAYRRVRRLKWHYRSQHESLIAFSNDRFYDRELVIFPAPGTRKDALGLRFHHVPEGRWEKRSNIIEAQHIARAVINHAHKDPKASLGIATFNAPQMEMIQEELDRLLRNNSDARHMVEHLMSHHEPLFIKNVENLQGDERDVIFISYTYGPDAGGIFAQRFYPINTDKGWRRFNVLITRARQRIEVFTSMLPENITGGQQRPFGVQCMRDYLTYVQSGKLVDAGTPTGRPPDSDFEVAVAHAVQRMGFGVHAQVGVAGYFVDLGVLVPSGEGDYLLGIECDGATYHSAKSARDRDRLRQEVIEKRDWSLHRIWSTDWFRNQASEEARLQKALDRLMAVRRANI
ncbi:MAG: DUF4011 domain-containing protein [Planctomycetes bacterium]|nr:DUF4011 domain-containing protein [Planctomycetota bacterium]